MMRKVPEGLWIAFDARMESAGVSGPERHHYRKWLLYYLDFCTKYAHPIMGRESVALFAAKLAAKKQTPTQCDQAGRAVNLYHAMVAEKRTRASETPRGEPVPPQRTAPRESDAAAVPASASAPGLAAARAEGRPVESPPHPPSGAGASWAGEFEGLKGAIRLRNYSPKTLEAYQIWVRKFQAFLKSKPA